jgi:hypothetical protein
MGVLKDLDRKDLTSAVDSAHYRGFRSQQCDERASGLQVIEQ